MKCKLHYNFNAWLNWKTYDDRYYELTDDYGHCIIKQEIIEIFKKLKDALYEDFNSLKEFKRTNIFLNIILKTITPPSIKRMKIQ